MGVLKKQKMTSSLHEFLIVSKDDVNTADIHDCCCCPLTQAIELGLGIDVIKALISPVAIKLEDNFDYTPLHHTCCKGASLEILTTLLDAWLNASKEKDNVGHTPFHYLCKNMPASFEMLSM
eukprot:6590743-Ditylum_brightwellii.AAC.1